MRVVMTVLGIAGLLLLLFIYSCMKIVSREDEWEEQYMDADWSPVDEDL